MPLNLNEAAISKAAKEASASGKRHDLVDARQPGLRLRLTPSGGKSWVLACRDRFNRMRRFPLGAYPAMGVSEAREAARVLHLKVKREGADPIADRRRERAYGNAAREGVGTLKALIDLYGRPKTAEIPAGPGAELKSWPEAKRRIEYVFKPFLGRPLAELQLADLQLQATHIEPLRRPRRLCATCAPFSAGGAHQVADTCPWSSAASKRPRTRSVGPDTCPTRSSPPCFQFCGSPKGRTMLHSASSS